MEPVENLPRMSCRCFVTIIVHFPRIDKMPYFSRFRRPSSSFSLTGPMNLSPYRPRHDSSSSESESNGRKGDRRMMEGLVEAGERQREEDAEAERDAEASIPKDQMRGSYI